MSQACECGNTIFQKRDLCKLYPAKDNTLFIGSVPPDVPGKVELWEQQLYTCIQCQATYTAHFERVADD